MWCQFIRSVAYGAGCMLIFTDVLLAQELGNPGDSGIDFTKWALTQGGLVMVTLIILWSYRKDFKSVLETEKDKNEQLVKLVQDNTEAMITLRDAFWVSIGGGRRGV